MPLLNLPPIPGISLFLFAFSLVLLAFGLISFIIVRRKERQKALRLEETIKAIT